MIRLKISKQWRPVFLTLLAVVALLVRDADGDDSTKSRIKIGRETTFLVGPLRTDGTVDYAAGINARMKQDVTNENNVCVLLCEAMQPLEAWDMPPEYFKEIERTPAPKDRSHVRYLAAGIADPTSDAAAEAREILANLKENQTGTENSE